MSGVIEELFVPDGEKVTAGAQLCRINTSGSAASQPAAAAATETPPTTTPPPQAEATPTPIPTSPPPPPPLPGQQKKSNFVHIVSLYN